MRLIRLALIALIAIGSVSACSDSDDELVDDADRGESTLPAVDEAHLEGAGDGFCEAATSIDMLADPPGIDKTLRVVRTLEPHTTGALHREVESVIARIEALKDGSSTRPVDTKEISAAVRGECNVDFPVLAVVPE